MNSIRLTFMTAAGLLIALSAGTVSADIYRYKDENGVWHFSNINSDRRYKLYIKYHNNPTQYISDYGAAIDKASEKYGVESCLIKAVIRAESSFNHKATSSKGAQGWETPYMEPSRSPSFSLSIISLGFM